MRKNHFHNLAGEDKDQYLVVCDQYGRITGISTRADCHQKDGKPHIAFLVFVFDKKGEIILAKRSKNKSLWPLAWDASIVSHVLPKETVGQAARRRGREELGIDTDFKVIGSFYYFARQGNLSENEYCYVLVGGIDKDIDPNPIEIEKTRRITLKNLIEEAKDSPSQFTPWLKIALDKFSDELEI